MKFFCLQCKRMKVSVCALIYIIALAGCTASYSQDAVQRGLALVSLKPKVSVVRQYQWVLPSDSTVSIAKLHVAHDKTFAFNQIPVAKSKSSKFNMQGHLHPRIHNQLSETLFNAASIRFNRVRMVQGNNLDEYLSASQRASSAYLIHPVLIRANDQLSTRQEVELRGISNGRSIGRDTVSLNFSLYDAQTGKLLDSSTVRLRGAIYTSNTENIETLMRRGVQAYITSIHMI